MEYFENKKGHASLSLSHESGAEKYKHAVVISISEFIETKAFNSGRCTTTKHVSVSVTGLVASLLEGVLVSRCQDVTV